MTMRPVPVPVTVPVAVPAAVAVPVLDLVKPQATHTYTTHTEQMGNLQPGSCLQHVLIILHA